jgi:hypothetical protein
MTKSKTDLVYAALRDIESEGPKGSQGSGAGTVDRIHRQTGLGRETIRRNVEKLKTQGLAHIYDWTSNGSARTDLGSRPGQRRSQATSDDLRRHQSTQARAATPCASSRCADYGHPRRCVQGANHPDHRTGARPATAMVRCPARRRITAGGPAGSSSMMRDVTIYGVTAHRALAGSFVDMYRMAPIDSVFPIGSGDAVMVEHDVVQRLRLQRHTIRRAGGRSDEYIAIEPELEAILVLPFQARLAEAERRADHHAREVEQVRQRLAAVNAMPWYRRIWVAIRRAA